MDDKQSVGLNYFNRQGIVPAFSEQYLVFQRETCSQALAKLTLLRPQVADLDSLARLLEGTPLPDDLQRTLIYKENNQLLATLRLDHFENEWGIYGFVVTKTQRGRGLGRQVLQSALRMILENSASATIFLEVETENQATASSLSNRRLSSEKPVQLLSNFVKILHYFVCFPANWLKKLKKVKVSRKNSLQVVVNLLN